MTFLWLRHVDVAGLLDFWSQCRIRSHLGPSVEAEVGVGGFLATSTGNTPPTLVLFPRMMLASFALL